MLVVKKFNLFNILYFRIVGMVAGVAVGLLMVGIIIGILGVLGFYRLKQRQDDSMNNHLMKDLRWRRAYTFYVSIMY